MIITAIITITVTMYIAYILAINVYSWQSKTNCNYSYYNYKIIEITIKMIIIKNMIVQKYNYKIIVTWIIFMVISTILLL